MIKQDMTDEDMAAYYKLTALLGMLGLNQANLVQVEGHISSLVPAAYF